METCKPAGDWRKVNSPVSSQDLRRKHVWAFRTFISSHVFPALGSTGRWNTVKTTFQQTHFFHLIREAFLEALVLGRFKECAEQGNVFGEGGLPEDIPSRLPEYSVSQLHFRTDGMSERLPKLALKLGKC